MKLIATILLLYTFNANATKYYVANGGNDANNGTSTSIPWQTISKINSFDFISGDSILFNAGGSWNEQLIPKISNLYFGSYGSGSMPQITGFQTIAGWTNVGNIWSATFNNSVPYQNTVLINGVFSAKARYPNNGYLNIISHTDSNHITGTLDGTIDFTGSEIVIRSNNWSLRKCTVQSQTGSTLYFTPKPYYGVTNGFGYFLQNTPVALDTLGEWCILGKDIKVYAASQPNVQASSIDTLIIIKDLNNIVFEGIKLTGANYYAVEIKNSTDIVFKGCVEEYCGFNAIHGKKSDRISILNCSFKNNWNGHIQTDSSNYWNIDGNTARLSGFKAGMGTSGDFQGYSAFNLQGVGNHVVNNRIDSAGYGGILVYMDSFYVRQNVVSNFAFVLCDVGGIYTWAATQTINGSTRVNTNKGGQILSNIVYNGLTAYDGVPKPGLEFPVEGIYIDDGSRYVTVDSNTLFNISGHGFFIHRSRNITFRNNNVYNNGEWAIRLYNIPQQGVKDSLYFTNNAFCSLGTNYLWGLNKTYALVENIGFSDSNYFYSNNQNVIIGYNFANYNLSSWASYSGMDIHSRIQPPGVKGDPVFFYNPTTADSTIVLDGTYYGIRGERFNNTVTINPYKSRLLFKSIQDDIFTPKYHLRANLKLKTR